MLSKVLAYAALFATGSSLAQSEWEGTGCVMDAETELMKCLGNYASIPPAAPTGLANDVQAAYYCNIYTQLANCWAVGTYCREWQPLALAAQKFCVLANGTAETTTTASEPAFSILPFPPLTPSTTTVVPAQSASTTSVSVNSEVLSSVIVEASNVVTSIWNNDVGTAIPSITNDLITETMATWTQVTTATPSPATDPLASGATSIAVVTPLKRLRFARDGY